jgi:hypothetical protein
MSGKIGKFYFTLLLLALSFSYIGGLGHVSSLFFFISFLALFISFFVDSSYIRPVNIYLLIMNFYVFTSAICIWIDISNLIDTSDLFSTPFSLQNFLQAFRIGLVSLVAISWPLVFRKSDESFTLPESFIERNSNQVFLNAMLFLMFIALLGLCWYIYIHRADLIEQYKVALLAETFKEEVQIKNIKKFVGFYNSIFIVLILMYIVYNPTWFSSKIFWAESFVILLVNAILGSRQTLVALSAMIFWRYYVQRGIKWLDSKAFKISGLAICIFLLAFIAAIRERPIELPTLTVVYNFFYEFINSSIDFVFAIDYMSRGKGPPLFWPLLDPLPSVIPSFLIPGQKADLYVFDTWLDSIGGAKNFSPTGGYFLPGQLYLFTGSIAGVFIYFSLLSIFLSYMCRKMMKRKLIDQMRGLLAASIIIILSVRHPYRVHGMMIILFLGIVPFIIYSLADIFILKYKKREII